MRAGGASPKSRPAKHFCLDPDAPPLPQFPSPSSRSPSPGDPEYPLALSEICWRTIKTHVNSRNVVQLIQWADQLSMPEGTNLRQHCQQYVAMAYTLLRERLGLEQLGLCLDPKLLKRLEESVQERARYRTQCHQYLGRVLEPAAAPDYPPRPVPSVSGCPSSYDYVVLVSGVCWPPDVDPSQREKYLADDQFIQVIGLSFSEFSGLPSWKRTRLKQDAKLF